MDLSIGAKQKLYQNQNYKNICVQITTSPFLTPQVNDKIVVEFSNYLGDV